MKMQGRFTSRPESAAARITILLKLTACSADVEGSALPLTPATTESAASFVSGPIAANEWVAISGSGISPTTGAWTVTGTQLPTTLKGVTVTVNNEAAPISFVEQHCRLISWIFRSGCPA